MNGCAHFAKAYRSMTQPVPHTVEPGCGREPVGEIASAICERPREDWSALADDLRTFLYQAAWTA